MRPPRALLFDYGDTLLHIRALDLERGVEQLFRMAGNPRRSHPESMLRIVARLQNDWQRRTSTAQLEASFAGLLRHAAGRLGLIFEQPMEDLEWAFWQAAVEVEPTAGIETLLETAVDRGLPCGIVSNSIFTGATLRRQLEISGLAEPFRFIMASVDYCLQKPHPELFATAAAIMGAEPADIWFLGDSLVCDIAGANEAGMQSIWYNPLELPRQEAIEPVAHVSDWMQVVHLLGRFPAYS